MPYSVNVNKDTVQILPMLKVLFTQDSKIKIYFLKFLPALNPACTSAIISSARGLSLYKMNFRMTLHE